MRGEQELFLELGKIFCSIGLLELYKYTDSSDLNVISKIEKVQWNELEKSFNIAINDKKFIEEFEFYLKEWVGRPNPLYFAVYNPADQKKHIVLLYPIVLLY